jgi:DHA1 family multidrug/chloramphenicol efflux transport protein-like MFS transporter
MGLCFIVVVGYSVLQELFTEMDAIRLIALMGNVAILAPLLGPLAGALLSDYMTWRAMFLSVAGFALIAFIGLWRYMPELIGQTKINGDVIEHTPLSMKNVLANYTSLLKNKTFMFGSIALGLLALPCVVWIALSPVMLVKYAHLTPAQYALWQIPVFGGIILGNITLTRLSYHYSINRLRLMGGLIVLSSLLSMFLLPCIMGEHYIWLTPGLVLYSFGQGIAQPPLMRSVLFATHVPKGTASAMLCTCSMSVQAIGIEIANLLYGSHSNMLFGFYNAALGVLFFVLLQSLKVHISDKSSQSL